MTLSKDRPVSDGDGFVLVGSGTYIRVSEISAVSEWEGTLSIYLKGVAEPIKFEKPSDGFLDSLMVRIQSLSGGVPRSQFSLPKAPLPKKP